jgi:hypothetical protein
VSGYKLKISILKLHVARRNKNGITTIGSYFLGVVIIDKAYQPIEVVYYIAIIVSFVYLEILNMSRNY